MFNSHVVLFRMCDSSKMVVWAKCCCYVDSRLSMGVELGGVGFRATRITAPTSQGPNGKSETYRNELRLIL